MSLPEMRYGSGIGKSVQVTFAGYDHTAGAGDGAIWDMQNLTGDLYPVLAPREKRYLTGTLTKPNGLYARDGLYWADGTGFYADGELKGAVTDGRKTFASLGAYIVILPDKAYYNRLTGEFGSIESRWSGAVTIQDGVFAGENAKANTIQAAGVDWSGIFRVGDAVKISGCTKHEGNNKTAVVREIDRTWLRFYENVFEIDEDGDAETVEIAREMPELEFVCENENRLWGCRGNEIYACKLGDIFNWNVFDGLSTDSYAVTVGSAGDFTGACSYLGYPCFFKEEHIYKVYGDRPANFQVMGSASLGTAKGAGRSFAIAGEVLYYLSRIGIVAYSGGVPQSIASPFGTQRFKNAVGGSDGQKYYVSMEGENGWELFVYDTQRGLWHREDESHVLDWGWNGGLYRLDADGKMWFTGGEPPEGAQAEGDIESFAEFADFTEGSPNVKGTGKLLLRLELEEGARLTVAMQFDSDGVWREVKTLYAQRKRSVYLPIIPRRSDHFRIRLSGRGAWRLHSMTRESYTGSELRSV